MLVLVIPSFVMFVGVSRQISSATRGSLYDATGIASVLLPKNWYHFINPFSGIGFQLVSLKTIQLFGTWDLVNFGSYIKYLFPKVFIILSLLSIFIVRLITNKPNKYFFLLLGLEGIFLLLLFGLMTSFLFPNAKPFYDFGSQLVAFFAGIVGSFVLSVSLVTGLVWWREQRKNFSLFFVFICPIISLLFILFPWVYASMHFTFEGGIHRYLAVPAVGMSIFLAALVNLGIRSKNKLKLIDYIFVVFIFVYFLITAQKELSNYFDTYKSLGVNTKAQGDIQEKFYNTFIKDKGNLLVYFEPNTKPDANTLYWQTALEFGHLPDWSYLDKYYELGSSQIVKDCVAVVPDYDRLEKSVRISKGKLEFSLVTLCKEDLTKNLAGNYVGISTRTFREDQFFAFTVKDGKIIAVTDDIIRKLKKSI